MPYIKKELRKKLDGAIMELAAVLSDETDEKSLDGALNYTVCRLMTELYPESYFNYNRLVGVLECIKMEIYRRRTARYEDKKRDENGDVEGW